MTTGFAEFDTAVGRCALAWHDATITRMWLPGDHHERDTTAPPPSIERVIDAVIELLDGEPRDLTWVPVDMSGVPDFDRRVYEVARTIAPGSTATYGDVAARIGAPRESRRVGQALGRNPFPIVVPCHRVVGADGEVGGFSAAGGVQTKQRLLAIEGSRAEQTSLFE